MLKKNKKFCPECRKLGQKSSITQGATTTTAMAVIPGHWDEEGDYHPPKDPNERSTMFTCSKGHTWFETT